VYELFTLFIVLHPLHVSITKSTGKVTEGTQLGELQRRGHRRPPNEGYQRESSEIIR